MFHDCFVLLRATRETAGSGTSNKLSSGGAAETVVAFRRCVRGHWVDYFVALRRARMIVPLFSRRLDFWKKLLPEDCCRTMMFCWLLGPGEQFRGSSPHGGNRNFRLPRLKSPVSEFRVFPLLDCCSGFSAKLLPVHCTQHQRNNVSLLSVFETFAPRSP